MNELKTWTSLATAIQMSLQTLGPSRYIHLHGTKAVYSVVANVHLIVLEIFVLIGAESAKACAYLLDLAPLSDLGRYRWLCGSVQGSADLIDETLQQNFKIEFLQTLKSYCSPV